MQRQRFSSDTRGRIQINPTLGLKQMEPSCIEPQAPDTTSPCGLDAASPVCPMVMDGAPRHSFGHLHWSVVLSGLSAFIPETASRTAEIALIDGLVMEGHPAFADAQIAIVRPSPSLSDSDVDPHATFMASIFVGARPHSLGLSQSDTLVNIPAFDAELRSGVLAPDAAARRICDAIDCAIAECVHVILLPLEFSAATSKAFTCVGQRIDRAAQRGIRTVLSAGNRPGVALSRVYDAAGAVPVMATDRWGCPRAQSPTHPVLGRRGLRAPGEDLPGAVPPDAFTRRSGASGAAAFVAAAFTSLYDQFPTHSADDVWAALLGTPDVSRRSIVPPLLDPQSAAKKLQRSRE